MRGYRSNDAVKEPLKKQYSVLLLEELNIKDTLYSLNRGTISWADSISSAANLINMGALCKTLEEVGIKGETPLDCQSISD